MGASLTAEAGAAGGEAEAAVVVVAWSIVSQCVQ